MPKNVIQHHEWNTRDPKRLQSFYGRIFDWRFFEAMPGYTMIDGIGGIFDIPSDMLLEPGVVNYVNVDDLEAKEKLIRSAGGNIFKSKQEVPGMGWFTMFADPDGNLMAMWQAMPKARKAASTKTTAKKTAGGAPPTRRRKTTAKKR